MASKKSRSKKAKAPNVNGSQSPGDVDDMEEQLEDSRGEGATEADEELTME